MENHVCESLWEFMIACNTIPVTNLCTRIRHTFPVWTIYMYRGRMIKINNSLHTVCGCVCVMCCYDWKAKSKWNKKKTKNTAALQMSQIVFRILLLVSVAPTHCLFITPKCVQFMSAKWRLILSFEANRFRSLQHFHVFIPVNNECAIQRHHQYIVYIPFAYPHSLTPTPSSNLLISDK